MESPEVDIKPTIPTEDTPDKSLLSSAGPGKLKQSRYEDVWPEEVHAAFMEAVALYPPMGKRRLKYYRISTRKNECLTDGNRAKSFGRCQLIQSYIQEKTGKNRSRKQVSSHLQRLKKIHKDNPSMCPLFSERSQPPLDHSSAPQAAAVSPQDMFANISFSTCHLKNDFDLTVNPQNTDTAIGSSSMFSSTSEASTLNGGPSNASDPLTVFHGQPSLLYPQEPLSPQQCLGGAPLRSSDCDYLSEFQDPLLLKNAINGGFKASPAFNASAFSISMRRFASKFPYTQGRQVDLGSTTYFSRATHSPGFQPTHQWLPHGGLMDGNPFSLNLAQQAIQTPSHPLQSAPLEKWAGPGLEPDWMWPRSPDMSLGPEESSSFGEAGLWYPPAMYYYHPTCPGMRVNAPGSHSPPTESEVSRLPRFSYSYAVTSPATIPEHVSGSTRPELPESPASPLVISPTPVYPFSYIHSKVHSDGHTPAPSLPS